MRGHFLFCCSQSLFVVSARRVLPLVVVRVRLLNGRQAGMRSLVSCCLSVVHVLQSFRVLPVVRCWSSPASPCMAGRSAGGMPCVSLVGCRAPSCVVFSSMWSGKKQKKRDQANNYINALAVSVLPFFEPAKPMTLGELCFTLGELFLHWVNFVLHWVNFFNVLFDYLQCHVW
jgi:hypothetical protein